jgi:hypothetical protein
LSRRGLAKRTYDAAVEELKENRRQPAFEDEAAAATSDSDEDR